MKKRIWGLLLAMLLCLGMAATAGAADGTTWDGTTVAAGFAGGTGTEGDPYRIETAGQLMYFRNQVNQGTKYIGQYIRLENDLDMNSKAFGAPIGYSSTIYFAGTFDGNHKTISNLTIKFSSTYKNTALFGCVGMTGTPGTLKNLTLSNVKITHNNASNYVGALCACFMSGTIENCHVTSGTITTTNKIGVGAIVGHAPGTDARTIKNCSNGASVSAMAKVAGIIGSAASNISEIQILDCVNTGKVSATKNGSNSYAAGIFGGVVPGRATIERCANEGEIEGTGNYVGGIAADHGANTINNCYNSGEISGAKNVGGIAGLTRAGKYIKNSHNVGKITASEKIDVGGITGYFSGESNASNAHTNFILNCYYLEGTSDYGTYVGVDEAKKLETMTQEEFADKTVYDLLQKANSTQVWGQTIGKDDYPVFYNGSNLPVVKEAITPTVTLAGWTYGEAKNEPVVTGNTGNGTVTYLYKTAGADDSTYTETVPTDAGSYTVKAVVTETQNHTGGEATADFEIAKAAAPDVTVAEQKHLYTIAADGSVDIAQKLPQDRGETTYSIEGTEGAFLSGVQISAAGVLAYSTAAADALAIGSITVKAVMANYADARIMVPVVLTDKTVLAIAPPAAENGTYDGQPHAGYVGAPSADGYAEGYDVIYTGRGATNYGPMADAPVNAGEYTVTFSIPAENLYYTGSASVDFIVGKAASAGEPTFEPIYRDGKTLADVTLGAENFSVQGMVGWDDPLAEAEKGVAYAWTFTPEDSQNYEQLKGMLIVYPAGEKPVVTEPAEVQLLSVQAGGTVTMTIAAEGTGDLAYQWMVSLDGGRTFEPVEGATEPSYTTEALTAAHDGALYRCMVSNLYGETASPVLAVAVYAPAGVPQTGDDSRAAMWMLLLAAACAGLIAARRRAA